MTSPTLTELAERVERLTGPCRETDGAIKLAFAAHLFAGGATKDDAVRILGGDLYAEPLPYTASLDATAETGKMALDCVLGIDKDRFACHHGMKEGQPRKLCSGYVAAVLAPWSFTKEVLAAVKAELDATKDGPDEVRAAFDAWVTETDPAGEMDVYRLARAYAARSLTEEPQP